MYLTPPRDIAAMPAAAVTRASWALIVLALLAPFAFYFPTVVSIVEIWNSSETFAHGYVILPISLWLVWRRRALFSLLAPTPWWPALALLLLAGAAWLLARMGAVQVVQQYAFAAMIPVIALALLGPRLAAALAFPLLFLLFAVPFGEVFIGPLIEFTADFTVWAVQLTGIPVLRNGTRFEIPTGSWSVVEACSGVRYLISSVTLGSLYAYLTYQSTARRLLFVAFSIVVPILANGLRAYMIVMIGHTSGMTLAVGVDHLIYGWLFFGLVMFLMFWIGSYWREEHAAQVPPAAPAGPGAARLPAMTLAVLALCALWPLFAALNARATFNPAPVRLAAPALAWAPAPAFSSWTPSYMAADASWAGTYRGAPAQPVALHLRYYRNQGQAKALISSTNRLAGEKDAFHEVGAALRSATIGARTLTVREARMRSETGNMLVWHWNWIDGRAVTNPYLGKLLQAKEKLLFRGDDGAAVLLSAPYGEDPEEARLALQAFLGANLDAIEGALAAARER